MTPLRQRVLDALADGPKPLATLADQLRIDIPAAAAELQRMYDARLVRPTGRGWQLRGRPTLTGADPWR